MRSYKANWCLFIDFLSEYILTPSLLCNLPFYLYSVSAETTKDSSVLHRGTCQQEEACRWQHLISVFCPYEEFSLPLKPCPCTRDHSALYALVALDIACHTYVWGKIDVRWSPRCACYQCRCIYSHVWKCLTDLPLFPPLLLLAASVSCSSIHNQFISFVIFIAALGILPPTLPTLRL